jgi:hypothetical protein
VGCCGSFDTIAREWRCKWSADSDKASLVQAQDALTEVLTKLKALKGVKGVQVRSLSMANEVAWFSPCLCMRPKLSSKLLSSAKRKLATKKVQQNENDSMCRHDHHLHGITCMSFTVT